MLLKLPTPPKKKRVETKSKREASKFKKHGYSQKKLTGGKYILEKKLDKWEYFQEEIRVFLESLGFQDTESGHSTWFGRYQIDVVGGYDGAFLVVECKSSNQPRLKKLTKEINIFAGKKTEIEAAIRDKHGQKYNEVKYVLALDDIEITDEDEKTAKENDIYIWGSNYLKTGKDLFSIIGSLTAHYVLKELNVSPKLIKDDEASPDYKVPCFRVTIGGQQIYSFFLPAEKLLNLVYVFRLQPGNEDAYQRFFSKSRITGTDGITDFINNGGFFKTSVVCSFERPVAFEKRTTGLLLPSEAVEFGILSIPKYYGTVWIIDGQHRIYGFARANPDTKKIHVGVVAYQDIEKKQQARDFIDINQKQKSVDPNTLWDLMSQTDPYSLQGAITKIAKKLSKKGIFKGKILIPGKAYHKKKSSYPLKLANVCTGLYDRKLLDYQSRDSLYKSTAEVQDSNRYPDSIVDYPLEILDEYFSLLWDIAEQTEWKKGFILHNNGFNVLLRVLVEILKFRKGNWNRQEVRNLIQEPLKLFFKNRYDKLSEMRTFTSNEAGRGKLALDIIKQINSTNDKFAPEFIRDAEKREKLAYEKSEPYVILKELETNLRKLIEAKLSEATNNWWKECVPPDVQEKAKKYMDKSKSPWPWTSSEEKSLISYVDFPDYVKVIERRDNWANVFQKIFKKPDAIIPKLRELEDIRNKIAHSRNLTAQESTTLSLYADQILKTINPQVPHEETEN